MDIEKINSGVLAYIGDAVYELKIRKYLISKKINKVNILQKESINFVSASSQADILDDLIKQNILTEKELHLVKRARNYRPHSKPKSTSIKTYKKATALEALFGMLFINNNETRIDEIMKEILR